MAEARLTVTLERTTLNCLDRLVRAGVFPSRGHAIREAISEKLARIQRRGLARECAKLDRRFEKALAEEGPSAGAPGWPEW